MGRSKLNTQVSSLGDGVEGEYRKSRFFPFFLSFFFFFLRCWGGVAPGFDLLGIMHS